MSLFSFDKPPLEKKPADAEDEGGDEGDDNAPAVEEESTAVFTPVVHLTEVEVKTMEEDEDVLYVQRAKLFVFGESLLNKGSGTKTWNERGTGDVKLLKHKETSHIRVLMRQEKTMKIIINHFLDPRITITPNAGAADKSWVWVAFDFSEGALVETTFAIRFKNSELAQEFAKAFRDGQTEMTALMAGADSTSSSSSAAEAEGEKKEADEAAKAIESLSVGASTDAAAPAEAEASSSSGDAATAPAAEDK